MSVAAQTCKLTKKCETAAKLRVGNMIKKSAGAAAILVVILLGYLLIAPVPVEPVAWSAPQDEGYRGVHSANTRLAGLNIIDLGKEEGPEHVAIGPDGKLYVAVASGVILRGEADGRGLEVFVNTGGRVLGFDFDASGRLIAADAFRGLLAITPDKSIELLTDAVQRGTGVDPIRYADAVVVAKTGKIYFSDASQRFGAKQWGGTFNASVLDILEHSSTGRILEYDPARKETRVLIEGLSFANGLALSQDERYLFVVETGEYRIWKINVNIHDLVASHVLKGSNKAAKVILANLPGYPDNLMRGLDGRLWVGFAKPRGKAIDAMASYPLLRKMTLRLPRALWPVPPAYGHVMAFDETGKVLLDLQDPQGAYPETTGVTETPDRLYIQSLHAKALGWLPKTKVGL